MGMKAEHVVAIGSQLISAAVVVGSGTLTGHGAHEGGAAGPCTAKLDMSLASVPLAARSAVRQLPTEAEILHSCTATSHEPMAALYHCGTGRTLQRHRFSTCHQESLLR
mmetsp:Transcript_32931/g.90931  ORF Transcript_32931/g.90931 Transcript_32931/m.90931 type:complete len:109 (-) Transcript_32931:1312-1638(-)